MVKVHPIRLAMSMAYLIEYETGFVLVDAGLRGEEREACADRNPLRNAYFGDLHVHTGLSFTSPDLSYPCSY